MDSIKKLEIELLEIVNRDKKNWTHFYVIMRDIEQQELWKEIGERSFTSWVKNFCVKNRIHESIIWNRKKAGKVYETYERISKERGEEVVPIEQAKVSVDALVLLDKINKKSPELAAQLTEKAINKEISREDLRNAYKTIRGGTENREHHANNFKNSNVKVNAEVKSDQEDQSEKKENITAGLIVNALTNSSWLGVTKVKRPFRTAFEQDKYRIFTEFPVYTGTSKKSRRIDVLVAENLTGDSWELNIHAIEIKVSKHDLLSDTKYTEYADFADYVWLAIPKELIEIAKDNKFDDCGIVIIDEDHHIEIIEQAKASKGLLKADALTSIALKLL